LKHKDLLGPTNQPLKQISFRIKTNSSLDESRRVFFSFQTKINSLANHPEGMRTVGKASKPAKQAKRSFSNLFMSCLHIIFKDSLRASTFYNNFSLLFSCILQEICCFLAGIHSISRNISFCHFRRWLRVPTFCNNFFFLKSSPLLFHCRKMLLFRLLRSSGTLEPQRFTKHDSGLLYIYNN
jgi:hypothetical protein